MDFVVVSNEDWAVFDRFTIEFLANLVFGFSEHEVLLHVQGIDSLELELEFISGAFYPEVIQHPTPLS